jgi:hypothetical protein
LDKINDLQKTSDNLHHALYTIHEVARHGFKNFWTRSNQAALLPSETDKLESVLNQFLGAEYSRETDKIVSTPSDNVFSYLQKTLQELKNIQK